MAYEIREYRLLTVRLEGDVLPGRVCLLSFLRDPNDGKWFWALFPAPHRGDPDLSAKLVRRGHFDWWEMDEGEHIAAGSKHGYHEWKLCEEASREVLQWKRLSTVKTKDDKHWRT